MNTFVAPTEAGTEMVTFSLSTLVRVIAEKGIFVREEDFFWFLYDTECGMLGVDLEGFHTSAVCVQRFGN